MKFFIKHHIVKRGETLEQIAALYQIDDVELLRYYHHQNVPKNGNHIGHTLFEGQEIFIPEKEDIDEMLMRRKKNADDKNALNDSLIMNGILLPNFSKIKHFYDINIIDELENNSENETQYDVSIQYLGQEEGQHIFHYDRKSILINGEKPDLKVYELALECSAAIFPVELRINQHGKIADISTFRQMIRDWKITSQKLLQKYEDQYSIRYIEIFDYVLTDKESLIRHLRRDLFLQFYFSTYFQKFEQAKLEKVSYFTNHHVKYISQYKMNIAEKIHITQSSDCIDERTQEEIIRRTEKLTEKDHEQDLLESHISGNFYLDKEYRILQNAEIKIEMNLYNQKEIKQVGIRIK